MELRPLPKSDLFRNVNVASLDCSTKTMQILLVASTGRATVFGRAIRKTTCLGDILKLGM